MTASVTEADALRWYFTEIYNHAFAPDPSRLDRFLLLSGSDVEWIVLSMRKHRAGRTWSGLHRLLERDGHEFVGEIGVPAATSWAIHLELLPRLPDRSAST